MFNDSVQEQLNYNMILLKHLDRISVLSTLIRDDDPQISLSDMARRVAYMQAIYSLKALIPSSLKDAEYFEAEKREQEKYVSSIKQLREEEEKSQEKVSVLEFYHRFRQLGIIIDLLNRKGMLLSSQMPARKKFKKTSEVFE